jgi:ATP-dependent DNA ligase
MATVKVGQKIFCVFSDTDDGTMHSDMYEVRSIRKGVVSAVCKMKDVTWVRKSKKVGDYGWGYIPSWCRVRWKQGDKLPRGYGTTKLAALRGALKSSDESRFYGDEATREKARRTLKRMITRARK